MTEHAAPAPTPPDTPSPTEVTPKRTAEEVLERVWAAYRKAWAINEACDHFTNRERGIREALVAIYIALTS